MGIGSKCVANCFAQSGAMSVGEQHVGGGNRRHFGGGMGAEVVVGNDRAIERRGRRDASLDRQGAPEARRMAIRQLHPHDRHWQRSEVAEAEEALRRAEELIERRRVSTPEERVQQGGFWFDWVNVELLRAEFGG